MSTEDIQKSDTGSEAAKADAAAPAKSTAPTKAKRAAQRSAKAKKRSAAAKRSDDEIATVTGPLKPIERTLNHPANDK